MFVDAYAYPPFTNRRVQGQDRHQEGVAHVQRKNARRQAEGDMVKYTVREIIKIEKKKEK